MRIREGEKVRGFSKWLLVGRNEDTMGPLSPAAGVSSAHTTLPSVRCVQPSLFSVAHNDNDGDGGGNNNTIMRASAYWPFPTCQVLNTHVT